jgi:alkylation response protein AidB-like acyl-CoA dehydrogenase
MDFALSEDQETLKKSAREFVQAEAPLTLARKMLEHDTGFEPSLWRQMAELGWMGIAIPEAQGGLGLGMLELSLLLEEMARTVTPSPFFSTVALAAPVLAAVGATGPLQRIAEGELRTTLALAEEQGRFDGHDIAAVADPSGGAWSITGRKLFVPDAHLAEAFVTVARAPFGAAVFMVDAQAASVITHESMDRTRRLGEVIFEGAAAELVSAENDAWPEIERTLDRAAVALAAEATGVGDAVMTQSVDYVRERKQFGRAIGSFQAVSHRCADMLVGVESSRSTTYYAAWAIDEATPDAPLAAATAKACASTAAIATCESGIQVHGGIGFTWEHDMHIYFRRAKLTELFLGAAPVWRDRITSLLSVR